LKNSKLKKKELIEKIEQARVGREETPERPTKIAKLEKLQQRNIEAKEQISKYADNDPEILDIIENDCKIAREAANRWTDNIWEVKKWCVNKHNMDSALLDKNWEIPEDFDYVE